MLWNKLDSFKKFIDFSISKQFEIIVNIEPEDHFYIDNEFDKNKYNIKIVKNHFNKIL